MRTILGLEALSAPEQGAAVAIGTFDGVHVGHRALLDAARRHARRTGCAAAAVTWDRHPNTVLRPDRVPPLLCTPERKLELLGAAGLELVAMLAFDADLSRWPPERFVSEVLVAGLGARTVCVGAGWRFGHRAAGTVALLARLGATHGFGVDEVALVDLDGAAVSSSRVRDAVADGDVRLARRLLGRSFDLDGVVVTGHHRGRALGYPTANLDVDPALCVPALGVYAGRTNVAGRDFAAAISVGVNPTFGGDATARAPRVEVHVLDFSGDLYGRTLRVSFDERLRDEHRFDSVEALVAQMARDVEETRALSC